MCVCVCVCEEILAEHKRERRKKKRGKPVTIHSHPLPATHTHAHTPHTYTLAYTHTLSPRPFFKTDAWSSVSAGMTEQVVSSAITQPLKNFALPLLTYGVVRVRLLMCAGEDV